MIDLTPLDVRKKRGDFTKALRGYETQQVDSFLELVAERLEELVKENLTLTERGERLSEQVAAQSGRERAVNDALVTAQQLREEISNTAEREAELIRSQASADRDRLRAETDREVRDLKADVEREASRLRIDAEAEARAIVSAAERRVEELHHVMRELERRRARFLTNFRQLLERELDTVEVQESRTVDEDMPVDLDLGGAGSVEPEPEADPIEPHDAPDDLVDASDDQIGESDIADGIRAEPLGVFEPVENVPPVPEKRPSDETPWGAEESAELPAEAEVAEEESHTPQASDTAEAGQGLDEVVDSPPDAHLAPEADPERRDDEVGTERASSSFFATSSDEEADETSPAEFDVELRPPAPDADVHRLATDARLSPEPPDSGLEWLEAEESEEDR